MPARPSASRCRSMPSTGRRCATASSVASIRSSRPARHFARARGAPNITVYTGTARFVGHKRLDTGTGTIVTADRWVLAAGSRATVPDIPGLALGPRVHTSDTIMFLDDLPRSVLVFGGGDVAAEFAHVFSAFGSDVIQVIRGDRLLRTRDSDISEAFTAAARRQWTLHSGIEPSSFTAGESDVVVDVGGRRIVADIVLVATGRVPNSDLLDVAATGVAVDAASGLVTVDEYQRTSVDGIFALGDICSPWELKHVANHEMRVVRHNLAHPDAMVRKRSPLRPVGGVHPPAGRRRRAERVAGAGSRPRVRRRPLRLLRHRRRAGLARTRPASSRCSPIPAPGCSSAPT